MNIILLSQILYFVSMGVWLIPPVRQFKGKYFYFFLILAIMDPISIGFRLLFKQPTPVGVYSYFTYFLLGSLFSFKTYKNHLPLFISISLLVFLLIFLGFNHSQNLLAIVLFHFGILFIILRRFITIYAFNGQLSVFYLFFILYELTIILKFFNVLFGFADATALYYITTSAQIIFGLFFSIIRES